MAEKTGTPIQPPKEIRCTKERVGVVVRATTAKTAFVKVSRLAKHPQYNKVVRQRKTYAVHDEHGKAKVGQQVRIAQSRPFSKTKHWRVVEVLER
jgi:small subunit ribosomal protein S17